MNLSLVCLLQQYTPNSATKFLFFPPYLLQQDQQVRQVKDKFKSWSAIKLSRKINLDIYMAVLFTLQGRSCPRNLS